MRKAERESGIPFTAYGVIEDKIIWPNGESTGRIILPYVWDEKNDRTGEEVHQDGAAWAKVRRNMLRYQALPCYTVNIDIPEYSEFGEMHYRVLHGMLFTG